MTGAMVSPRDRLVLALPVMVLALTVFAVPVMALGPNGLPRHRRLSAQLAAQRAENLRLRRQLVRLRAELEAFSSDPRARERAVREGIGWVRPDEVVVEVPPRHGR
jgi:cell division protein FtsB